MSFSECLLKSSINRGETFNASTQANHTEVVMNIFPNHMTLEFWVEAHNKLGRIESDHLKNDAGWFGKLNVVLQCCHLYVDLFWYKTCQCQLCSSLTLVMVIDSHYVACS